MILSRSVIATAIMSVSIASACGAAQAATVGMWHGDDSGIVNGSAATSVANSITGSGAARAFITNTGTASYSSDIVAPAIYDPVSGTTFSNQYSVLMSTAASGASLKSQDFGAYNDANNAFTIEFFVKITSSTDDTSGVASANKIIQRGTTGAASNRWYLSSEVDKAIQLTVTTTPTTQTTSRVKSTTLISDGQWHHVALTVSQDTTAGTGIATLYVDGAAAAPINYNGAITSGSLILGPGDTASGANYRYDEIRFSNTILAPSQFLQVVPEPATLGVLGFGGAMLWAAGKKKRS